MPLSVLTGDIVQSTKMSMVDLDQAFDRLAAMAEQIGGWPGAPQSLFERYRGDGWQMVAPGDGRCLRVALLMRAVARAGGADTRISIGYGERGDLGERHIGASGGQAFELSGRGLEKMERGERLSFWSMPQSSFAEAIVALCDALASEWTARQAELMAIMLLPVEPTQNEAGHILKITQSTISKQFSAAYGPRLLFALKAFEKGFDVELR